MSSASQTLHTTAAARLDEVYAAGEVPRASGGAFPIFPIALTERRGRALRQRVAQEAPRRTIETGCGLGVSALCIAAGVDDALDARGVGSRDGVLHTAIDPGQASPEVMDHAGRMLIRSAGLAGRTELIERPSELALPELVARGERYDLAFIDGAHWFEHVLIDLVMLARLVTPGGLIVVDDLWMPSVRTAVAYAEANLHVRREPSIGEGEDRFALLRVEAPDPARAWDHFEPFEVARPVASRPDPL